TLSERTGVPRARSRVSLSRAETGVEDPSSGGVRGFWLGLRIYSCCFWWRTSSRRLKGCTGQRFGAGLHDYGAATGTDGRKDGGLAELCHVDAELGEGDAWDAGTIVQRSLFRVSSTFETRISTRNDGVRATRPRPRRWKTGWTVEKSG